MRAAEASNTAAIIKVMKVTRNGDLKGICYSIASMSCFRTLKLYKYPSDNPSDSSISVIASLAALVASFKSS